MFWIKYVYAYLIFRVLLFKNGEKLQVIFIVVMKIIEHMSSTI